MTPTPEQIRAAIAFYEGSPDGQHDAVAATVLRDYDRLRWELITIKREVMLFNSAMQVATATLLASTKGTT